MAKDHCALANVRRIAHSFSSATSAETIGLSAKVAKPQSGVKSTRSVPKTDSARSMRPCDLVPRLHHLELLVHDADAHADVAGEVAEDVDLACARRR